MPPQPSPEQRRPRGPRKFRYTYEDIARAIGWTREQVMRTARAKVFDPSDLRSVIALAGGAAAGVIKPTAPRYGKARA